MQFVLVAVIILALVFFMVLPKKKQDARKRDVAAGLAPIIESTVRHVAGLSIASGVPCTVEVYADHLRLTGSAQTFKLPMDRVTGTELYEDTEMRQHVKSSLGGTILGGLAFGGIGAVIGAMPESQYRREIAKYNLLVAYISEKGEDQALLFTSDTPLKKLGQTIRQHQAGVRTADTTIL